MTKEESKQIRNIIHEVNCLNISQKLTMYKYYLKTVLYTIIVFGYSSDLTLSTMCLHSESSSISCVEKDILSFIKKNIDKIDYEEALEYIDMLDNLNDKTVIYYLEQYDNIETACDMHSQKRYKKDKKEFSTLIESNFYKICAYGLTINFDDIKEFLNYGKIFWNDIMDKIVFVDSHDEQSKYGLIFGSDDIKILIPKIVNLETALKSISILSDVYNKYYNTKNKVDLKNDFVSNYLVKKIEKD